MTQEATTEKPDDKALTLTDMIRLYFELDDQPELSITLLVSNSDGDYRLHTDLNYNELNTLLLTVQAQVVEDKKTATYARPKPVRAMH